MGGLADFWSGLLEGRHRELLRESGQERLAKESRRTRKDDRACRPAAPEVGGAADERTVVRPGTALDAPRIADLLELNGMPRWVAFEERFIVAEEGGALTAAMRFREGTERLYLGLLVTDPWAEEHYLAVALYSRARTTARDLGLREIRARTRRHEGQLYEAGYRRRGGVWRTWS
ncbi:MAG: hypothetical protein M3534_01495 [Actinomycetota bacterium]|nr:hypothetical protein [Actinomycetota bacterium]